ncbi:GL17385 [Drosophila persimilis]|uniref:GL17385 n=1 Tax=Drosophila persimilis TaxID=7234 RepID=B4GGP6_DROPE|nr:GL17385 [Drosophila persimilis]
MEQAADAGRLAISMQELAFDLDVFLVRHRRKKPWISMWSERDVLTKQIGFIPFYSGCNSYKIEPQEYPWIALKLNHLLKLEAADITAKEGLLDCCDKILTSRFLRLTKTNRKLSCDVTKLVRSWHRSVRSLHRSVSSSSIIWESKKDGKKRFKDMTVHDTDALKAEYLVHKGFNDIL